MLTKVFFLRLGKALRSTFVVHTSPNNYSTFGPHLFRCALLLEAPSSSSHLGPHRLRQSLTLWLIKEYDCVTKAFTPCPNLGFFKDYCLFINSSSSKFILAIFKFFDGILTKRKFGFFFKCVQVDIHPFNSPFN